jgi:hypothetical protein
VFEWIKRFKDEREDLQGDPRSGRPSTSLNADIIADVREMLTRDRRWALRRMADELNINKEGFVKPAMNIYGRGRSAQSSFYIDLRMSRSSRDSHHAKASSRLVKTIPILLTAFSFSYGEKSLQRKEISGC